MSDDWTAQAHICPICIDDHSPDRLCKRRDLIERITAIAARISQLEAGLAFYADAANYDEIPNPKLPDTHTITRINTDHGGRARALLKGQS
jgi:hypothetical protein